MKKRLLRYLALTATAGAALLLLLVFGTGDAGLTQRLLNGIEARALAGRSTLPDKLLLKGLYQGMMLTGRLRYPQATAFLRYYVGGRGDTLRFDARALLRHPEVQQALQRRKTAITFRHQPPPRPTYHAVRRTDWDLFYTFDLLFIRQQGGQVEFYDQYYFQPLQRRSRTPFRIGNIRFKLNDGLIHVAYPEAKRFTSYGQAAWARR
ncbi:hypothetical protein EJV47_18380 [Hymenobacter gummosus]|uniref:Uncharacterized protein n=1 Tax=Hymenobacter gummosus TaxID=1776032 RepID=A0A431U075_9BACT|nr:hypothetical protein [Hymenobacter gummosus]RTQ47886.1 hypothetical protein EJV47_18380 [Hymenobacter gummosus]